MTIKKPATRYMTYKNMALKGIATQLVVTIKSSKKKTPYLIDEITEYLDSVVTIKLQDEQSRDE